MADDAIALLMAEMGEQLYGGASTQNRRNQECDGNDRSGSNNASEIQKKRQFVDNDDFVSGTTTRRRLISEVSSYPNNNRLAGSRSIWNPYVQGMVFQVSQLSRSNSSMGTEVNMLPTNPVVEIVRRRSFEKFRHDMLDMLDRMVSTWEKQFQEQKLKTSRSGTGKNSRLAVPVAQMIEKFVMDAKLVERQRPVGETDFQSVPAAFLCSVSTIEILRHHMRLSSTPGQSTRMYDPILLSRQAVSTFIETTVRPQIQKSWQMMVSASNTSSRSTNPLPPKFEKKASQIRKATYKFVVEAHESFDKQLQSAAAQEMNQNGRSHSTKRHPKISHDLDESSSSLRRSRQSNDDNIQQHGSLVRVTYKGVCFKLHSGYLEKLQRLYDRVQESQSTLLPYPLCREPTSRQSVMSFEEALFCLLCRYDTIQGAGLQASVPGVVMDVLLTYFDCRLECFASPLNCRYDRYCSAFEDVDVAFGSHGSFFSIPDDAFVPSVDVNCAKPSPRCFEANPPFCEALIKRMDSKINRILALQGKSPVMFVVIVPAWKDAECYQGLLKNPFLAHHLVLKQRKHYFAEGTQHRRKDSFRVASFDTSVLFYQNDAAKNFWPLSGGNHEAVVALKAAFEEDPGIADKETSVAQESKYSKQTKTSAPATTAGPKTTNDAQEKKNNEISDRKAFHECKYPAVSQNNEQRQGPETKKDKRRWTEQGEEEAQMKLLNSLGISSDGRPSKTSKQEGSHNRKTKKKKNSRS